MDEPHGCLAGNQVAADWQLGSSDQLEPATHDQIVRSPFVARSGGFAVYSGLLDPRRAALLKQEARDTYATARHQQWRDFDWDYNDDHCLSTDRRAHPERCFLRGDGGPVQSADYQSTRLSRFLSRECGMVIRPSSTLGTFSYYTRPGDFIGLHRDVESCDVAVITVLHDESCPTSHGGALVLYPGRIGEPLSAIRAQPQIGAQTIKLSLDQTLVMFGGLVAHRVWPVAEGQRRVVSVLCFRAFAWRATRVKA